MPLNGFWRSPWVYLIVAIATVAVVISLISDSDGEVDTSLGEFLADVEAGRVTRIEVNDRRLEYEIDGVDESFTTEIEEGDTVREILMDSGVQVGSPEYPTIVSTESSTWSRVFSVLLTLLPVFLILGFLVFLLRQTRQAQNRWAYAMVVTNFDPVCRATVDPGRAAGSSTFAEITHYFCSTEHKEMFDADPLRYLLKK